MTDREGTPPAPGNDAQASSAHGPGRSEAAWFLPRLLASTLPLFLVSVVFLGAFLWQQSHSLAERMLGDRAAIVAAAEDLHVDPELALGLLWERRVHDGPPASWGQATRATLAEFVRLRQRYGALELALLAFCGQEQFARAALVRHAGNAVAAASWVRGQPDGVAVHRILGVGRRLSHTPRA